MVFRSDNEPSILSLLRTVKLAWTGDVVQETSTEGDPQSNGAAESSVNVVKGHVRSIKLAVESASGAAVLADHDLLMWLVQHACTVGLRWVETARQHTIEMWDGALFRPWHNLVSECGGCLCSHPTVVWALWIHDLNKEGTWDRWMDRTRYLFAPQVEW